MFIACLFGWFDALRSKQLLSCGDGQITSPHVLPEQAWLSGWPVLLVADNIPSWISGRRWIAIVSISWSISTKVWNWTGIELVTHGSAVRLVTYCHPWICSQTHRRLCYAAPIVCKGFVFSPGLVFLSQFSSAMVWSINMACPCHIRYFFQCDCELRSILQEVIMTFVSRLIPFFPQLNFVWIRTKEQWENWASAWEFQQFCMCDQQSLRSACAYAQSDQSLW